MRCEIQVPRGRPSLPAISKAEDIGQLLCCRPLGKMYGESHVEEAFFGLEGDVNLPLYPNPNFSRLINRK